MEPVGVDVAQRSIQMRRTARTICGCDLAELMYLTTGLVNKEFDLNPCQLCHTSHPQEVCRSTLCRILSALSTRLVGVCPGRMNMRSKSTINFTTVLHCTLSFTADCAETTAMDSLSLSPVLQMENTSSPSTLATPPTFSNHRHCNNDHHASSSTSLYADAA
jgi:hypothetical protein